MALEKQFANMPISTHAIHEMYKVLHLVVHTIDKETKKLKSLEVKTKHLLADGLSTIHREVVLPRMTAYVTGISRLMTNNTSNATRTNNNDKIGLIGVGLAKFNNVACVFGSVLCENKFYYDVNNIFDDCYD